MIETFAVGQRVTATRFGVPQQGTVTRTAQGVSTRNTDGRIVWVQWDGTDHDTWMHAVSLTPVEAR